MTFEGISFTQAPAEQGVTPATARKWLERFLGGGESALVDASWRPTHSPRCIESGKALLIVELRRRLMLQAQIARSVGVSESTVSRVLASAGLSKLSELWPTEPVQRFEYDAPGDLLHIDTKKLGRILVPSKMVRPPSVAAMPSARSPRSGAKSAAHRHLGGRARCRGRARQVEQAPQSG